MKTATSRGVPRSALTPEQRAELDALARLPDSAIDTADIPEALDWSGAKRGALHRPEQQEVTLRLDTDLLDWFKSTAHPDGDVQPAINRALRQYVTQQERKAGAR